MMITGRLLRSGTRAGKALVLLLLTGILIYLLFGRLGDMFIADYDEARHGVNAYEMIRNNDYLVSTYQGETDYWNLKPPMSFWLIALGYRIFGYNALGLRFFSALSILLAVGAIAVWTGRKSGFWAAVFVLFLFAADKMMYGLHFSRFGDADAGYQLFFSLAMLCALMCERDIRWIYGSGLFFGLAFLEKGLHAANIPIACLAILLCTGWIKKLRWKHIGLLLVSGLILIAPWAAARYSWDGLNFLLKMFSTDVADRMGSVANPADIDLPSFVYYCTIFIRSPGMMACLLLSAFSVTALLLSGRKMEPSRLRAAIGCFLWAFVPLIAYSIMNVKYRWYSYSTLMAMPPLTGILVTEAVRGIKWKKGSFAVLAVACTLLAMFTVQNIIGIVNTDSTHTVQDFLKADLDRDLDSGIHTYIQFNEDQQTVWMQGDMLIALFYGDVDCRDGGVDGYLEDDDNAILYVCNDNNMDEINMLMEQEAVRSDNYYITAFEK